MSIQNITNAQNAVVGGWQAPQVNVGGNANISRGASRGNLSRDLDGHEKVGTYGIEFTPGENDSMIAHLNSSVERRGRGEAYPVRQIPELFGLTKESFQSAISTLLDTVIDRHGALDAEGVTNINWQPPAQNQGINVNYQEQEHFCIPVGPNHLIVVSGLYEPRLDVDPTNPSPDWLRSQYLMRLGRKSRARNITQRFETGQFLELRNGSQLPLVILIDKQEAAPEITLKPRKMGRMATPGAFAQPAGPRVLVAASAETE